MLDDQDAGATPWRSPLSVFGRRPPISDSFRFRVIRLNRRKTWRLSEQKIGPKVALLGRIGRNRLRLESTSCAIDPGAISRMVSLRKASGRQRAILFSIRVRAKEFR